MRPGPSKVVKGARSKRGTNDVERGCCDQTHPRHLRFLCHEQSGLSPRPPSSYAASLTKSRLESRGVGSCWCCMQVSGRRGGLQTVYVPRFIAPCIGSKKAGLHEQRSCRGPTKATPEAKALARLPRLGRARLGSGELEHCELLVQLFGEVELSCSHIYGRCVAGMRVDDRARGCEFQYEVDARPWIR